MTRRVVLDSNIFRGANEEDLRALRMRGFMLRVSAITLAETWARAIRETKPSLLERAVQRLRRQSRESLPLSVARQWLARTDDVSEILAKSVDLTADVVDEAASAAEAFSSMSADASLEGPANAKDSPAVNRAEGRILPEMFEARRLFNEANAKNGLVPKLSPGAALRHAVGVKVGRGGAEVEGGAPEEAGGGTEGGASGPKEGDATQKPAGGGAKPK